MSTEKTSQGVVESPSVEKSKAARFFKIGDRVTDCGRFGRVGEVVELYDALVTVDWGVGVSTSHYTDLDLAD